MSHPLGLEPSGNALFRSVKNLRESESLGVLRELPDEILLNIITSMEPEVRCSRNQLTVRTVSSEEKGQHMLHRVRLSSCVFAKEVG